MKGPDGENVEGKIKEVKEKFWACELCFNDLEKMFWINKATLPAKADMSTFCSFLLLFFFALFYFSLFYDLPSP